MSDQLTRILTEFEQINKVPRCSKNEKKISDWLCSWADEHKFQTKRDTFNNVLIRVPATPGNEDAQIVVLQGHMDMVCEKNEDTVHDFAHDPIRHILEDGWLHADGTTLGSDNGIALAMALAAATDPDLVHPPMELLFTVDEETGLTGANNLSPDFVDGKILINIDSEDEGVFTIGCAGGRDTRITLKPDMTPLDQDLSVYLLKVTGLSGGHSGVDIHKQKANAIQFLARALHTLKGRVRLLSIHGGTAHNAIPREARALIALSPDDLTEIRRSLDECAAFFVSEYAGTEGTVRVLLEPAEDESGMVMSEEFQTRLISMLLALPHGVNSMSRRISGLVESSSNLARIRFENNEISVQLSQRSSQMSILSALTARIEAIGNLAGASVKSGNGYPSWEPNFESDLLKRCQQVYLKKFGKEAKVEIIHAGLECGIIGSKYAGMDMISIGPTIESPHSPDERLNIASVEKVARFLDEVIYSFCH